MGKLKLGIPGNDYLAGITAGAGLKGMLDEYEPVGVLGRTREKTELLAKKGGCQVCGTIDELLVLPPDYVAEATSVQSVKNRGAKILESGVGMIVLLIGVFVDHEFFEQVKAAAVGHKTRVYIMSGAVEGFDVLWTISLMGQAEAGIRTRKGPASLKGIPLFAECLMEDGTENHVFRGSAKGAISLLPTKVNVAVASSLVTAGPEDTRMGIYGALGMIGDDHKITSKIEGVKAVVDIYSSASITADWSVVAALQNTVSPIVFQEKMDTFKKLAAIEPVSLIPSAEEELHRYAGEITLHEGVPSGDGEIIWHIGNVGVALISYTPRISRYMTESCPSIRYIGMCRGLYSEESANVDIACVRKRGVTVLGIRGYGDKGVAEYVLSRLARFFYGFDRLMSRDMPVETTDLEAGIIEMDVSGGMIADVLKFMGADVSYYSRSRKQDREDQGMTYRPLKELLGHSEVVLVYLSEDVTLFHEKEFRQLGQGKFLFNTSIGPAFNLPALKAWPDQGNNYFICDTERVLGDSTGGLFGHPDVFRVRILAGRTKQALDLLSKRVLDNIRVYLEQ